jgi:hypothetical protein
MLDKNLVHALLGAEDSNRGLAELCVKDGLTNSRSAHDRGLLLLDL